MLTLSHPRHDSTAPIAVAAAASIVGPPATVTATNTRGAPDGSIETHGLPTLVLTFFGDPGETPADSPLELHGWRANAQGIWYPRFLTAAEIRLGPTAGAESCTPSKLEYWAHHIAITDGAGEARPIDGGIASLLVPLEGCTHWSIGGTVNVTSLGYVYSLSGRPI